VHPKTGKGFEKASGVGEIENLSDTILRYVRMSDDEHDRETQNYKNKSKVLAQSPFSEEDKKEITAMIVTEKIREGGSRFGIFLEWDEKRGVVVEVSMLPKALEYEHAGYWTRSVHRVLDSDVPDQSHRPYKED
jgi:hypothetical protein